VDGPVGIVGAGGLGTVVLAIVDAPVGIFGAGGLDIGGKTTDGDAGLCFVFFLGVVVNNPFTTE